MSLWTLRSAREADLSKLTALEAACFADDRLSRRSFARWLKSSHSILQVACVGDEVVGYGLVWLYKGTRLARLYSLAVHERFRRRGIGRALLSRLEELTAQRGRLVMRLEAARTNRPAIALYESIGYRVFGLHTDYYENHTDALRLHKRIRTPADDCTASSVPWYGQTTPFTCGPAALMMAMGGLNPAFRLTQDVELDIWREATTIFMTSGHGGCHPLGMALSARQRGFAAAVVMNCQGVLFVDGVRSAHKKAVIQAVDAQFRRQVADAGIVVVHGEVTLRVLEAWLARGLAVVALVSTYRTSGSKAPHWVTVTAVDDRCLYVHDPEAEEAQGELDLRDIPIARADFARMSVYGRQRLRAAVVIGPASAAGQPPFIVAAGSLSCAISCDGSR